jgi:hypothetical protein
VKNGPKSSRLAEPRPGVGHGDVGVTEALRDSGNPVGQAFPGGATTVTSRCRTWSRECDAASTVLSDRSIPPAGLEPAASGLRVRRHSCSTTGACQRQTSRGNGRRRCRLCRRRPPTAGIETTSLIEVIMARRSRAGLRSLLRWQGSNLRLAINSRVSYRSTTPEREAEGEGVEPPRPRPTRFRDGIPRQMAVLPTGDPGRTRTCTTPIKSRALYRIELRSQGCGRQGSNLQRPAFQAGALPALSYDHADGRGWNRTSDLLFVRQALGLSELLARALMGGAGIEPASSSVSERRSAY